jgi:hypothetical protein
MKLGPVGRFSSDSHAAQEAEVVTACSLTYKAHKGYLVLLDPVSLTFTVILYYLKGFVFI